MAALLAIGTRNGLFLASSRDDRRTWELSGPHFPTTEILAIAIDRRPGTPRLLAGTTSSPLGTSVSVSDDLGRTWRESQRAPAAFPPGADVTLSRVWQLTPGPAEQPGRVYAGTEPSALFASDDGGTTFELMDGLWDHPHRPDWGAGFGGQAVHTVLPHPADPTRVLIAMSTGGVYRTADGGISWAPANTGIRADFLPDPAAEFGQCVHKVARDAVEPDRLYAQSHHGVYRSDDDAASWHSIADGLPSDFGFAMVAHPWRGDVIYNFPVTDSSVESPTADTDELRVPPGTGCGVYRSADAGRSWEALTEGLGDAGFGDARPGDPRPGDPRPGDPRPGDERSGDERSRPVVLRDAMCADDAAEAGIYFGTRSGEVFASRDEGDSWAPVADGLPGVLCVRAALL
jgi:hypothetical protein